MFTGIVEEVGVIKGIQNNGELIVLDISVDKVCKDIKIGDSISVNGVCLTLTKKNKNIISFDVMQQTIKKTDLNEIKNGDKVNLERSLRFNGDVSGHFVYGHVDGMRKILDIVNSPGKSYLEIEIQNEDKKYIVDKGSISVSGISLTIGEVNQQSIRLFLIPHTFENTILKDKKKKDLVNVEFDMIAKYVHKQQSLVKGVVDETLLRKTGFMS